MKDYIKLPEPTNNIEFFQDVKDLSNNYWNETEINKGIYGFQIQHGTKWKNGLSALEILDFEKIMGFNFPKSLQNFYLTMNGLSKKGINVYGNDGSEFSYRSIYYSFPDDIEISKENIRWIYELNQVTNEMLINRNISRIFPVCGHRFMLIDEPSNPILSMNGSDIIPWSLSLSNLLVTDIFINIYNASDYENNLNNFKVKFWLDERNPTSH